MELLKATAKASDRAKLWQWLVFCSLFIVLSVFLVRFLGPGPLSQIWMIAATLIGLIGAYFGLLLAIKEG